MLFVFKSPWWRSGKVSVCQGRRCIDSLEKEMAAHSGILAEEIPCTEVPGELQSMESQSWTQLSMCVHLHTKMEKTVQ